MQLTANALTVGDDVSTMEVSSHEVAPTTSNTSHPTKRATLMTRFIAFTILFAAPVIGHAQDFVVANIHNGELSISTNGFQSPLDPVGDGPSIQMVGLSIRSASGSLVPFDPPDASPFLFFLSNTGHEISMASLPAPAVVMDDQVVIGYTGSGLDDITASYGDAAGLQVFFPTSTVPEPNAGLMVTVAALGLFCLRQRR